MIHVLVFSGIFVYSARQPLPNTDRSRVGINFPSPNWDVLVCVDSYVNR
jgi:hypothetical protein